MSDPTDKTLHRVMKAYVGATPTPPNLDVDNPAKVPRHRMRHPAVVVGASFVATVALVVIAAMTLGSTDGAPADEQVSSLPTYTLADGRVYSVTACPAAANLLVGGHDAADGLPSKGQTERARVESMVEDIRARFVGPTDVVAVNVVPRNGEVWFQPNSGDYVVELVSDFQYEFVLSPDGECPSSPYSINGVPVLYSRAGG